MKEKFLAFACIFLLLLSLGCAKKIEQKKDPVVEPGKKVTFDYAAGFTNGTIFDTSFEEVAKKAGIYDSNRTYQPVVLKYGTDPLLPGYQEAMLGMKEGEVRNVIIPPSKAYGDIKKNATLSLSKTRIQGQQDMRIGSVITLMGPNNVKVPVYITKIGDENITVDINHPLAGFPIQFSVVVRKIE